MEHDSSLPAALIFDMDGVLVDSNPFHLEKWIEFLNQRHIPFKPEDLPKQIFGQRNDNAFRHFLGTQLSQEEIRRLSEELEEKFREAFRSHARPLPGLHALITECHRAGVPMAVASSAMAKNVEFIVDTLGFCPYFRFLTSGDEVSRPKPDPEIYLRTANKLGLEPATCVAFEDSYVGLESVKQAGMKCVAIASTFSLDELQAKADLAVRTFEEVSLDGLGRLFVYDSKELNGRDWSR